MPESAELRLANALKGSDAGRLLGDLFTNAKKSNPEAVRFGKELDARTAR